MSRLLIVDDNSAGRMMFERVAKKLHSDWEVTAVKSAEQALQLVDSCSKPYDWIALDIVMPDIDGIALARLLQERGSPSESLILLSASEYELKRVDSAMLGPVHQMLKPVQPAKLAAIVERTASLSPKAATIKRWEPTKL